ncbi:MAG: xanthine dehydrogenase subunit XdhB [Blautia sp.]|nr:xanthine dehydrogenase subunit XdhB [Blautia sp.]
MYDIEKYYEASTIEEAVKCMTEHPQVRIICGGSDVLIKIREGKFAGTSLLSIRNIKELSGIERKENGDIYIGAGTVFSHITADPVIRKWIPVLGEAVDLVGGPQIRNIGTIGGNICNGAVSADSAPTVFSLNGILRIAGPDGIRMVPVQDFYLGPGKVDLRPAEILTHVIIPFREYDGYKGHYIKYSMRNAMDIATLSCSVVSKINLQNNILEDVRITFGVAAPVPFRCTKTEQLLSGEPIGDGLLDKAEQLVRTEINPRDSWRASKDFRIRIGGEIARRALEQTIHAAGGGIK